MNFLLSEVIMKKHNNSVLHPHCRRAARARISSVLFLVFACGALYVLRTRALASVLVVNNSGDLGDLNPGDGVCEATASAGDCTLRAAIQEANALAGADTINFSVGGGGSTVTFTPGSALPVLTEQVTIDGVTQFPASTTPPVILNGSSAGARDVSGIEVVVSTCVVRGLVIRNFSANGIAIGGSATGTQVQRCYVGTNDTGTAVAANGNSGIVISGPAASNTIGGSTTSDGNVISGNTQDGIRIIGSNGNLVRNNYLGTNAAGTGGIANAGMGIRVQSSATNNTLGGSGVGNLISGNSGSGIHLTNNGTSNNKVFGNVIGLRASGTQTLLNNAEGILIDDDADNNTVGSTTASEGNVISGNGSDGIEVSNSLTSGTLIRGNVIGSDAGKTLALGNAQCGVLVSGTSTVIGGTGAGEGNFIAHNGRDGVQVGGSASNSIRGNSISSNSKLGINLINIIGSEDPTSGIVTANDASDNDTGPNNLQNFPVLTGARVTGGNTIVDGNIDSATPAAAAYPIQIDFYSSSTADPSGNGEGATFLGSVTRAGSPGTFTATLTGSVTVGHFVTATATDNNGNTSEFSLVCPVVASANPEYGVTHTGDSGVGSLREAINYANLNAGTTIRFKIPTTDATFSSGVFTLTPATALPTITANGTIIDGSTQTSFTGDTNLNGPEIALNGTNTTGANGLAINASNGMVKSLIIKSFGNTEITLSGSSNQVLGCYLGTNNEATASATVATANGVKVASGTANTIGGSTATDRNIISGHSGASANGVWLDSASNIVRGNYLGTDRTGSVAIGNRIGIFCSAASNTIGGSVVGQGNVISGNTLYGIRALGVSMVAQGNFIGLSAAGNGTLANQSEGVLLEATANNCTIGGTTSGQRNVISGNGGSGIKIDDSDSAVIRGNYLGTDSLGLVDLGNSGDGITIVNGASFNTIGGTAAGAGNIIAGNEGHGIKLEGATSDDDVIQGNYIGLNVSGALLGNTGDGININAAALDITIGGNSVGARNVISGNGLNGVFITGNSASIIVQGNYLGTDPNGTVSRPNAQAGVKVAGGANGNTIGGSSSGEGNLISGNAQVGVLISGSGTGNNKVQGNTIGLDSTGTAALGNVQFGIRIELSSSSNSIGGNVGGGGNRIGSNNGGIGIFSSASGSNQLLGNVIGLKLDGSSVGTGTQPAIYCEGSSNTIGGTTTNERNVISASATSPGIHLFNAGAEGALVQGNFIGTDIAGTSARANSIGILVDANNTTITSCRIGGTAAGEGNTIAFNTNEGLKVTTTGIAPAASVKVLANSIHTNGALGINLVGGTENVSGVTANDTAPTADADTGNNKLQNFPQVSGAAFNAGTTTITGSIDSTVVNSNYNAPHNMRIDIYTNTTTDPSGNGEGRTHLGSTTLTNPGTFSVGLTGASVGESITATATDNDGNTSEFSLACPVTSSTKPVYGVTNTNDSGAGSLRQAITDANAGPVSGSKIIFKVLASDPNFNVGDKTITIKPASALPGIGQINIEIDGTTQQAITGDNTSGLEVVLDGSLAGAASFGLAFGSGSGSGLVKALAIGNFASGSAILIQTSNNRIENCHLGSDATGIAPRANAKGISITSGASSNTIGGSTIAVANVISGNSLFGLYLDGSLTNVTTNVISSNTIGLMANGTGSLANNVGVHLVDCTNNTIGASASEGNVISGNTTDGVQIKRSTTATTGNVLSGNIIGGNPTATAKIPNGGDGVEISGGAQSNTVGLTTTTTSGNQILGNGEHGVRITGANSTGNLVRNNRIGTNTSNATNLGNSGDGVNIQIAAASNIIGGAITNAGNTISGNGVNGLAMEGNGSNQVLGNLVGVNSTGSAALANIGTGIAVTSGSNTIGGTTSAARNIISGNARGIQLSGTSATGNLIMGNYIGLDTLGATSIPNTNEGVRIQGGAATNTVGGTAAAAGNVISGNSGQALLLTGTGTTGTLIQGNLIGLAADGNTIRANGCGIAIEGPAGSNTIGGTVAGAKNVVSGNTLEGVLLNFGTSGNLVQGNYIGTDNAGSAARANTSAGVVIANGSTNNVIGGTAAGEGNLISGNAVLGLSIAGSGTSNNLVQGNRIGMDITGNAPLANLGAGVTISSAATTNTLGTGNLISGNSGGGVSISGTGTNANVVRGNTIGLKADGTSVGNGANQDGVNIASGAQNNLVGGTTAADRNLISENNDDGVELTGAGTSSNAVTGNYIGTDATGAVDRGNGSRGVVFSSGASNNTLGGSTANARNVISGNNNQGVELRDSGTTGNQIISNYIGLNADGTAGISNGVRGVFIHTSANGNTVGGAATTPGTAPGNVISGQSAGAGVGICTNNNLVRGNLIGTTTDGLSGAANSIGVQLDSGAQSNVIGGVNANERNVISGNGAGVELNGATTTGNRVEGNFIGTNITGAAALANSLDGVALENGANANTIGGTAVGAGNLIAFNTLNGVDVTAATTLNNQFVRNSIHSNGRLGIDLDGGTQTAAGVTQNDAGDADTGPNKLQNWPSLSSAQTSGGNTVVAGNLDTTPVGGTPPQPPYPMTIDFYSTPTADASGNGEGQTYLGSTTVNAPGNFAANLAVTTTVGHVVTAVVTDVTGNSSEFSNVCPVISGSGGPAGIAVTTTADNVPGSLREAIATANGLAGTSPVSITFKLPVSALQGTPPNQFWQIQPTSALPTITRTNVTIDGPSQATFTGDKNAAGPDIVINGATAASARGLDVQAAGTNCTIRGVTVNGFSLHGIAVFGAGSQVMGCYVGTNFDGTAPAGNGAGGILVMAANVLVGNSGADFMLISGNTGNGLSLQTGASGALVRNCNLGLNRAGTAAVANTGDGVSIVGGSSNTIGGLTAFVDGNNISGNLGRGVSLGEAATTNNLIRANCIGGNALCTAAIPNGSHGVLIFAGANNNSIGSPAGPLTGNAIIGSASNGVLITDAGSSGNKLFNNAIGTNSSSATGLGNAANGVQINLGAAANQVGGTGTNEANIISGNTLTGVQVDGAGTNANSVVGNLIGTNLAGMAGLANVQNGVAIQNGAASNLIGGTTASARNVISGNTQDGILLTGASTAINLIQGNYIGTNLNGTSALPNAMGGVKITDATGNTIGGLTGSPGTPAPGTGPGNVISGNATNGITIEKSSGTGNTNNLVQGNLIGLDKNGTTALPNTGDGIVIQAGAQANIIGGTVDQTRNVISGNAFHGVTLNANNNTVSNNFVGTNVLGTAAVGNIAGVVALGTASGNSIGVDAVGQGNVISGNNQRGVTLRGSATANNVFNNKIGTQPDGLTALVSNPQHGVAILETANGNVIGGTTANRANIIAQNGGAGVLHTGGNNNRISGNSIRTNGGLGIDLSTTAGAVNGVTANDTLDPDTGPNALQNFPVLTSAQRNTTTVNLGGTFNSIASQSFTLEFFSSPTADSGNGEGQTFLGTSTANTDGSGNATISVALSAAVPAGSFITATATDASGNTSEFSNACPAFDTTAIVVSNTNDSGNGSLRKAMASANLAPGSTIVFNIPTSDPGRVGTAPNQYWQIQPLTPMPQVTAVNTTLNGSTQAAFIGGDPNANGPEIVLNGSAAGPSVNGLLLSSTATGSTIRGLVVNGFSLSGLQVQGANAQIMGCYVGTSPDGMAAVGNVAGGISVLAANALVGNSGSDFMLISGNTGNGLSLQTGASGALVRNCFIGLKRDGLSALANGQNGVAIQSSSTNNVIGGTTTSARNVVSGNVLAGMLVAGGGATGNQIQGNHIGTNALGTAAVPNFVGVKLDLTAQGNTVGGTVTGAGNLISGNTQQGILNFATSTAATCFNHVYRNLIGVQMDGTSALGNGAEGVRVEAVTASNSIASDNFIGSVGNGNTIAFNGAEGVLVIGAGALPRNIIRANAIHSNTKLGINLDGGAENAAGVTTNDPGDADAGPNNLQNYPVLSAAQNNGANTVVSGNLDTAAGVPYNVTLEFFSSPTADPSGYGEGAVPLGTRTLTGPGNFTFSDLPAVAVGQVITVTATSRDVGGDGNTSEFSNVCPVISGSGGPAGIAVTTTADAGPGSLRQAILTANATTNATITFKIPAAQIIGNVATIQPTSPLPNVTGSGTTIDGMSQAVFGGDTNANGPEIVLDGVSAGTGAIGLHIEGANSTIKSLVVSRFNGVGIEIGGGGGAASGVRVEGCYLGTNSAGTTAQTNGVGLRIHAGSLNNTIGGTSAAQRNVISGNTTSGVRIDESSQNNSVQGNYIGTNAAGTGAVANSIGILIIGNAANNVVGGTAVAHRNLISGNSQNGVEVTGTGATSTTQNNRLEGNFIGLNVGGSDLGNGSNGVLLSAGASNTTIGLGNVISGNGDDGVEIRDNASRNNRLEGNFIGTNPTGTTDIANDTNGVFLSNASNTTIGGTTTAKRNVISGNEVHGVAISGSGATNNQVLGNFIGTDVNGMVDLANLDDGVFIYASANNNMVGGTATGSGNVISGNEDDGIDLDGALGNQVQGNFIGLNANGTAVLANLDDGVAVAEGSANNLIGGTVAGARNVISGNDDEGIDISDPGTMNNLVQGNFIGTDVTGMLDLGNDTDGVCLNSAATNNTIGGTTAATRNVISGNDDEGVELQNAGTSGNLIQGNYIGVAVNGTSALGNVGEGVSIFGGASGNAIGGATTGAGNVIAHSGQHGVRVADAGTTGNRVQQNNIHSNGGLGLNLVAASDPANGVTPNDVGDADTGTNNLQNFPQLLGVLPGASNVQITGTLNSLPSSTFTVDFFGNTTGDPSGHGEGETYLGSATVTTDALGNAPINATLSVTVAATVIVTATATDASGNSSEFSATALPGAPGTTFNVTYPTGVTFLTMPCDLTNINPADLFGVPRDQMLLAEWDPAQQRYVNFTGSNVSLRRGVGYWIRLTAAAQLLLTNCPPQPTLTWNLRRGWNNVGNAFDVALPWRLNDIQVTFNETTQTLAAASSSTGSARQVVANFAWTFNGSSYQLVVDPAQVASIPASLGTATSSIPSGAGSWVFSNEDNVQLTFNSASFAGQRTLRSSARLSAALPADGSRWATPIEVTAGSAVDRTLSFGFNANQTNLVERMQKPPIAPSETYVDAAFAPMPGARFASDIRRSLLEGEAFEFNVTTNAVNEDVTVRWPSLGSLSRHYRLTLVDPAIGVRRAMRTTTGYSFRSERAGLTTRRLRIEIGSASEGRLGLNHLSLSRIGSGFHLAYTLTHDAEVGGRLLNPAGKIIANVPTARSRAGLNSVAFEARDALGRIAPRGVYLFELTAANDEGEQVKAVKSVVVK